MNDHVSDPIAAITWENKLEIYRTLRDERPIYWSPACSGWIMARYNDVNAALRNPETLAFDPVGNLNLIRDRGGPEYSNLARFFSCLSMFTRSPRHELLRNILARVLAATRDFELPDFIDRKARSLLAEGKKKGSIDLAEGYGRAIALSVIGMFLEIPQEDMPELTALGQDLLEAIDPRMHSLSRYKKFDKRAETLMEYFHRLVAAKRRSPGEDGISIFIRIAESAMACDDPEIAGLCAFFFLASEESTSGGIASAAHLFMQDGELRARLTAEPQLVPALVRETLRLAPPFQFVARKFGCDQTVAGQIVKAGETIIMLLGAANRDPRVFPRPDECLLDRTGPESLAFVTGPYRCVGAQLASMELEIAIRNLLEYPTLRLSSEPPVWSKRMNLAPLMHLHAGFA